MTDYEMHEPDFAGTTEEDWDAPQMEDFETDDPSKIGDRFVLSASGLPPEEFTDLKLPVVDPDGNLNRNALQTAKSGSRGVVAIEDIDDVRHDVEDLVDRLANERFEDADFGD